MIRSERQDTGASATQTGLGAPEGAEPPSRLGATPAIPSAAPWWRCLHCGCDEYEEHVFTGHMKGTPMIHCANCQVLHSPPNPNSPRALRWQISELADALDRLLELQDFHDDRAHWEREHKLGNGAAWRVLQAMDALEALR